MATAPQPQPFQFPREHSFPPFFTPQPNAATHHAQLAKWTALVLSYARHHALHRLSLSAAADSELFHNRAISRRAPPPFIREIFEHMVREQRAEFTTSTSTSTSTAAAAAATSFASSILSNSASLAGPSSLLGAAGGAAGSSLPEIFGAGAGAGAGRDVVLVYWRTVEEWADGIEEWVESTGQRGGVLTLWEMTNGENTRRAEFHGLDREILLKALNLLVKRGKAQIFGAEDSLGVKFF